MLDWIDPESWEAFREMRRRIKAPLTPYAEKLIARELVKLKAAGHDPQACLDQSIMLGWRDVFPVREKSIQRVSVPDELERYRNEKPQTAEDRAKVEEIRARINGTVKRVA